VDASALLEGVAWSSGNEARQTLDRARDLGYATATADAWDDVDRPADVARLWKRLSVSSDHWDQMLLHEISFLPQGVRA